MSARQQQLFQQLRGLPAFREWINDELRKTYTVLTHMTDADQLRVAQGRAQCLESILSNMDHATENRGATRR